MEQAFARSKNFEAASKSAKTAKSFYLKNFATYGIMCVCVCAHAVYILESCSKSNIFISVNWLYQHYFNVSTIG